MYNNYYCLVAGLPDLSIDDNKTSFTLEDFKTQVYPYLSAVDSELVDLFFLKFDNLNVLRLLKNDTVTFDPRGNFSQETLVEYISMIKEGEEINRKIYPSYLTAFIKDYLGERLDPSLLLEDYLTALYYDYAMRCGNEFISGWFEYNLNINNILTALTCRKHKWSVVSHVVGNTEICKALRVSSARDFGLTGQLEEFDTLLKISELPDLLERERKLDIMRWNKIEDEVFFNYFTIERIFAFLLKIDILGRWNAMDSEKGNTLFHNMLDSLKKESQIPEEFR